MQDSTARAGTLPRPDSIASTQEESKGSDFFKDITPEPEEVKLLDFDYLRITETTDIAEPDPVLKINGEIIAAIEDIFTISGASKSGKSSIQNIFIAGAISENGKVVDGSDGIEILQNDKKKAVIHCDTEQARHKHQRNYKNILKRASLETCPYFLSYNIRQLDIKQYAEVTTGICEAAFNEFGGIHSIWIDGGADYIADVNNSEISNTAIKYFSDLAIKFHTAVFIIVHTNPGGDKERGHFGSQCQRKSGGILSIKTEGDISYIEAKMLRYAGKGDIPQLMFKYDKEKGYHVGCGVNSPEAKEIVKKRERIKKLWELCKTIFGSQVSYDYNKALHKIMIEKTCKERTAKDEFSDMHAYEMILQGADKNWRINQQYINEIQ